MNTGTKRMLLAGVGAGIVVGIYDLVVNEMLLSELNAAGMNFEPAASVEDGPVIVLFVLYSLGLGTVLSWAYSIFRSHYGSGLTTAGLAAGQVSAVMVLTLVYPTVIGIFEWSYFVRGAVVILVQMLLAAVVARAILGEGQARAL